VTLALDTNVFIDLIRGKRPNVRQRHKLAVLNGDLMVTSLIVFHELRFGVIASRNQAAEEEVVKTVLQGIAVEPLTEDDVAVAAAIRARLKITGDPIGPYDVLIAGQAMARGWTLVTSNVREFERVRGLDLQDWNEAL
jgi:tRNA(fMet)-specific endonuclease VapC